MSDLAARMAALKSKMGGLNASVAPGLARSENHSSTTPESPASSNSDDNKSIVAGALIPSSSPKDPTVPGEASDEQQTRLIAQAASEPLPKIQAGDPEVISVPKEIIDRDAQLRLAGLNAELPLDEYKEKFEAALTRDRLSEIANFLLVHGPYKPLVDMAMEEIQDHIELMTKFIVEFRVVKQRAVIRFNENVKDLTEQEREKLRKRDRAYKPRPSVAKDPNAKTERKAPQTREEKAITRLMKDMNWTYEKAKKFAEEG